MKRSQSAGSKRTRKMENRSDSLGSKLHQVGNLAAQRHKDSVCTTFHQIGSMTQRLSRQSQRDTKTVLAAHLIRLGAQRHKDSVCITFHQVGSQRLSIPTVGWVIGNIAGRSQSQKNHGSVVALLSGKFLQIRKVFATRHIFAQHCRIGNCPNGQETVRTIHKLDKELC